MLSKLTAKDGSAFEHKYSYALPACYFFPNYHLCLWESLQCAACGNATAHTHKYLLTIKRLPTISFFFFFFPKTPVSHFVVLQTPYFIEALIHGSPQETATLL